MVTDCSEFRKIRAAFNAYDKNTGRSHPAQSQTVQARDTGAELLTGFDDSVWYGNISVGTPASMFTGEPSRFFFQPKSIHQS